MESRTLREDTRKSTSTNSCEGFIFDLKDSDKIEEFENLLSSTLKLSDSIPDAIEMIVKAAVSVEFGQELLSSKVGISMVKTICSGIMSDSELRKQSLIIMDRFAKAEELNA